MLALNHNIHSIQKYKDLNCLMSFSSEQSSVLSRHVLVFSLVLPAMNDSLHHRLYLDVRQIKTCSVWAFALDS